MWKRAPDAGSGRRPPAGAAAKSGLNTRKRGGTRGEGPAPDGEGAFFYLSDQQPMGETVDKLQQLDPRLLGTPKKPMPPASS